jgi:multiple sugar transport system substrate-binding protein
MKPRLVFPLISLLLALLLCACDGGDRRTVLRFWGMGREGEVVAQLIAEFEREHPHIRVDVQQLPWTAAHEKLLTAFAGDALPDVCQLGNTWLAEFAALGALAPLDAQVKQSSIVDKADFFAAGWDTNVIGGRLLGIPWYLDTRVLFYRKDLLAEAGFAAPPRDWEEWRRTMAALQAQGGGQRYAILLPLDEFEPLLQLALQQHEPLLAEDGTRGNFRSAGFRRAFDFYTGMFRAGWAPPMSDTQISNVWNEFARGFNTFYITGPWNIGEFRRRLPPELKDAWATAPLPGYQGRLGGVAGGTSLALFASSPHKQEAWQLIEFLSRPEMQLRLHALTGDLPPRRSAWNNAALANDAAAQAFRVQFEQARPVPAVAEWERIAIAMQLAAERVVRGGVATEDALRRLDAEADAILEKRRWMRARAAAP